MRGPGQRRGEVPTPHRGGPMAYFHVRVWRNGKFAANGLGFRRHDGEVMVVWPGLVMLAEHPYHSDPAAVAESARAEEAIEAAIARGESEVMVDGVVCDIVVD